MANEAAVRVGVDIGGTFTDVALEIGERRYTAKTLTRQDAPEQGILTGLRETLASAAIAPGDISVFIYGTTLATNLLIERKGSPTALLTTEGFRDSIEMRNENRYEQYDVNIDLPPPLVPRALRFPIVERMNARGEELVPIDEAQVEALVPVLEREQVQSLAIGFLHSYMNAAHEERARDVLNARLPEMEITLSSEVSPEMREFERLSSACANAYLQPLMSNHLRNLEQVMQEQGVRCPVFLMLSGGGITTLETAIRFPVRLVESGPAGGAIFAAYIARTLGLDDVVSYDMGGTTAKICLIDDGQPQTARTFEVARVYRFLKGSGLPLRIPVIEMVEIGAGGGSIATVDAMGRIAVGPESAGSGPGPACYALGGEAPTVTDADLVLGRLDPESFAGGAMHLDRGAAETALARDVGGPLDLEVPLAALGVSEMVDENMSNAARVHAIESGKLIEARTLVAFGGAAPVHASRMAEKLNMDRVVIPPGAGVGSAIGFLRAPVSYEVTRSHYQQLDTLDVEATNALLEAMQSEAYGVVEPGAGGHELFEQRTAYMRYVGQGHEVGVEIPVRVAATRLGPDAGTGLRTRFEQEYHRLYERTIPDLEIEILTWVVLVSTRADLPAAVPQSAGAVVPEPVGERALLDTETGDYQTVPAYTREALPAGARIDGPAVIVEKDTATVVTAPFTAHVHALGSLIIERRDRE
ncbi:MAG: hydantoinase/oxoprolinase family protein [Gammaproteobacteria bacterium]|nr:hydantoinase/oxoprolinase family protein [Gammaproteobacteria bacterium]